EEIDGLSLLSLSSTSIEELLSTNTNGNVLKKPTIGFKTTFEKTLVKLKENVFSNQNTILTLNEKQSDILIQQLHANQSNNLLFFGDFNIDNDNDDVDQRHHLMIPMSNSNTSNLSLDQVSSKTNSSPFIEVLPNQVIHQFLLLK
ncbi:unnamed protein product, partial [Rotaria sp. Silwood2]